MRSSLLSFLFSSGFDRLFRGVAEVVGGDQYDSTFFQELLAFLDVCSLQPNDERNGETDGLGRGDDSLRDYVAFRDPAKNVHQDCLDAFVADKNLERFRDLLFGSAPADV